MFHEILGVCSMQETKGFDEVTMQLIPLALPITWKKWRYWDYLTVTEAFPSGVSSNINDKSSKTPFTFVNQCVSDKITFSL